MEAVIYFIWKINKCASLGLNIKCLWKFIIYWELNATLSNDVWFCLSKKWDGRLLYRHNIFITRSSLTYIYSACQYYVVVYWITYFYFFWRTIFHPSNSQWLLSFVASMRSIHPSIHPSLSIYISMSLLHWKSAGMQNSTTVLARLQMSVCVCVCVSSCHLCSSLYYSHRCKYYTVKEIKEICGCANIIIFFKYLPSNPCYQACGDECPVWNPSRKGFDLPIPIQKIKKW